jgi:ribosome-binding protein aMBF1 (putative translation factor)
MGRLQLGTKYNKKSQTTLKKKASNRRKQKNRLSEQKRRNYMSDLQAYIRNRKQSDPDFASDYVAGYQQFKIGVMLKLAREDAGLTQEEVAKKLNT